LDEAEVAGSLLEGGMDVALEDIADQDWPTSPSPTLKQTKVSGEVRRDGERCERDLRGTVVLKRVK
jgi:hypothetical protein